MNIIIDQIITPINQDDHKKENEENKMVETNKMEIGKTTRLEEFRKTACFMRYAILRLCI